MNTTEMNAAINAAERGSLSDLGKVLRELATRPIPLSSLENVEAGTDGLAAGTVQATFQALATRIEAVENV